MKSKARYLNHGIMLRKLVTALLLMGVGFNVAADEGQRQARHECAEVMIKKRSVRPAYYRIEKNDDGIAYKCTLRKKQYKKESLAKFQRECESFVNNYIRRFNRCHDADIPKTVLNEPRDGQEEVDTKKFRIYRGQIEH
jgi:hypothetical protein